MLALDGRQGLRAARRVASGGIHGMHVGARDPLRVALREAASAFLLVHNHPSGDPTPSDEDVAFTRSVCDGAAAIAVPLLDHVIVARRQATSMLEAGLLTSGRAGRRCRGRGKAKASGTGALRQGEQFSSRPFGL